MEEVEQGLLQALEDELEVPTISETTRLVPHGGNSAGRTRARLSGIEQSAERYNYRQNWTGPLFLELHILLNHAGTLFLRNIQEHLLVVAPVVTVGHLSTTSLAVSAIASSFSNVTGYSIIRALTSSFDGFLAKSSSRRLARIRCQRISLILILALLLILQLWYRSDTVISYLNQEKEVTESAHQFLKATAIGLPAFTINEIMKRYLSCRGHISVQTLILTIVLPLNIFLNYILVFGPKSINLGFIGAPLSISISYITIAILTLFYVTFSKLGCNAEVCTSPHPSLTHGLFLSGLAGIGRSASESWSKEFGSGAACFLSINALATQAVLLATASTAYQAPRSLVSASASRVKVVLAKGDIYRAIFISLTGLMTTLVVVGLLSIALLAFAPLWAELFTSDPEVIQSASAALPFVSLYIVLHGFSAWLDGMLCVIGKTAVFPVLWASFDYSIGIPVGVWLTFERRWGLSGFWTGLVVALAVASVGGCVLLVKSVWHLARPDDRVRPDIVT